MGPSAAKPQPKVFDCTRAVVSFALAFVISGLCRADMAAIRPPICEIPQTLAFPAREHTASIDCNCQTAFHDLLCNQGRLITPLPAPTTAKGRPSPEMLELTESSGSLGICIYTILGLGLLRYAPQMRKFSFAFVPEWYSTTGPFQIGHKHAIAPHCLPTTPSAIIRPQKAGNDALPKYIRNMLAPIVRESVFTPTVLHPRGPPRTHPDHCRIGGSNSLGGT